MNLPMLKRHLQSSGILRRAISIFNLIAYAPKSCLFLRQKIKLDGCLLTKPKIYVDGESNQIHIGRSLLKKTDIFIIGNNNIIRIGKGLNIKNLKVHIEGSDNYLKIENDCRIDDLEIWVEDDGNSVAIHSNCSFESGCHLAITEGTNLTIGKDCMFSNDVEVRTGDSHAIFDRQTCNRINLAKDITIGNHVWVCAHSRILKGSEVGDGCIIGNSTIVNKAIGDSNAIIAGNPSNCVKQGILWARSRHTRSIQHII